MGREVTCTCERNGEPSQVKALIEPPHLILRGGIGLKIPIARLDNLAADGSRVTFHFKNDRFALVIGEEAAAKWVNILRKPLPTLANKLGIAPDTKIKVIGQIDDEALRGALEQGQIVLRGKVGIIIARVSTRPELENAVERSLELVLNGAHLWIVYRKGKGNAINEHDVRETGLAAGIVDVKVAAVSDQLTGLKFVRRKAAAKK